MATLQQKLWNEIKRYREMGENVFWEIFFGFILNSDSLSNWFKRADEIARGLHITHGQDL